MDAKKLSEQIDPFLKSVLGMDFDEALRTYVAHGEEGLRIRAFAFMNQPPKDVFKEACNEMMNDPEFVKTMSAEAKDLARAYGYKV